MKTMHVETKDDHCVCVRDADGCCLLSLCIDDDGDTVMQVRRGDEVKSCKLFDLCCECKCCTDVPMTSMAGA